MTEDIDLEEGMNRHVAWLRERYSELARRADTLSDMEKLEFTGINMYLADLDLGR